MVRPESLQRQQLGTAQKNVLEVVATPGFRTAATFSFTNFRQFVNLHPNLSL